MTEKFKQNIGRFAGKPSPVRLKYAVCNPLSQAKLPNPSSRAGNETLSWEVVT